MSKSRHQNLVLIIFAACFGCSGSAQAVSLRVGLHIHSDYSRADGVKLETIARKAQEQGLDGLIFTDTALSRVEYGLWPLRDLVKLGIDRPSVLKLGPKRYLGEIKVLRKKFPGMLLVPGTEAAAYYRWSGSPFSKLIMHDWNRHLLIIGMEEPRDYLNLPVLGNRTLWSFSRHAGVLLLILATWRLHKTGRKRSAVALLIIGTLLVEGLLIYRSSFSPYSDQTSWEPYRNLIRYASNRNALTFWAHPEAANWERPQPLGHKVFAETSPYLDCLEQASQIDGFGVFMEGYKRMAQPGAEWDQASLAYLAGTRAKPAWGIAELDFGSFAATAIDSAYVLAEAEQRSVPALLGALRRGRFQSVAATAAGAIEIRSFTLSGKGQTAGAGEALIGVAAPWVDVDIQARGGVSFADITLVRNGKAILIARRTLPATILFRDAGNTDPKSFYRVMAVSGNAMAFSNPAFCFAEGK